MQSKRASLAEALSNTAVGYIVSVVAGQFIYPAFGLDVNIFENMGITAAFTALAITRSYIMRRYYNWRELRKLKATRTEG